MENNTPTTTDITPEIQDKMNRWAVMGRTIHNQGLVLQSRAQDAVKGLILAPTVAQIAEAEAAVKATVIAVNAIETDRKAITSKFDKVIANLMEPEKSVKTEIEKAKAGLLAAKQIERAEAEKEKAKSDELVRIREYFANYIAAAHTRFTIAIANKVAEYYSEALNNAYSEADVTATWLPAWTEKGFLYAEFEIAAPNKKPTLNTPEDAAKIWQKQVIRPAADYMNDFRAALKEKFEFYGLALKNKEQALKANAEANERAAVDAAATLSVKETANKLESLGAMPSGVTLASGGKAIKEKYVIEMPDDWPSMVKIAAAFIGAGEIVRGGIRVESLRSLSIKQMAAALEWAKNKDAAFTVTGINFVKTDKL